MSFTLHLLISKGKLFRFMVRFNLTLINIMGQFKTIDSVKTMPGVKMFAHSFADILCQCLICFHGVCLIICFLLERSCR